MGQERTVPRKQLVPSVARQGYGNPLSNEAGEQESGQKARIGKGLIEAFDCFRNFLQACVAGKVLQVMLRPQPTRGQARKVRLVEAGLLKPDRERLQWVLVADGQRSPRCRIDATAEKDPNWDVRDQSPRHRLLQQLHQLAPD